MIGDKLKKEKIVITVAGPVGVGKSYLTRKLADTLNYKTSFEQVEENPYLMPFYNDLATWSFKLQVYLFIKRYKEQLRMFQDEVGYIQDRSIYEDYYIFAPMLFEQGNLEKDDFNTYKELFETFVHSKEFPNPDVLIYITGDLETIIKRINGRGREMELQTSLNYWKDLHQRYEKWIEGFNRCPVIKIDIKDYDLKERPDSIFSIIEKIEEKI